MTPGESEKRTRRDRIDPRLRVAGWKIVDFRPATPLSEYRRAAGTEFDTTNGPADYTLCDDGLVLGVVEGKKVSVGPGGVLPQAERYSRGVTRNAVTYEGGFHVPFLYSTNGTIIKFHDIRDSLNTSRDLSGFHTPTALHEMWSRDLASAALAAVSVIQSGRVVLLDRVQIIGAGFRKIMFDQTANHDIDGTSASSTRRTSAPHGSMKYCALVARVQGHGTTHSPGRNVRRLARPHCHHLH